MSDLYLKYIDEYGEERRIAVDTQDFFIGRSSDNDLCIPDPKLSRIHLKVERFGDAFLASDENSSNGTKLNGYDLTEPTELKPGDILDLGGGARIETEFEIVDQNSPEEAIHEDVSVEPDVFPVSSSAQTAAVQPPQPGGSPFKLFFILAPLMLLFVLVGLGTAIYFSGGSDSENARTDDPDLPYSSTPNDETAEPDEDPSPLVTPDATSPIPDDTQITDSQINDLPDNLPPDNGSNTTPQINSEAENLEILATSFLRKIAATDRNPVVTGPQLKVLKNNTDRFRNSSTLAANIENARKNSAAIASLASQKHMKPQFLAVAALAQLGNSRGDVAATAQSMLEVLGNVMREVGAGNETANDSLLTIAAYDTGKAGKERAFRDKLSRLTSESRDSSRQVRTIWFLKDRGKISNNQFEFAMRFFAIGTITQNPKAFNVSSEALQLN